MARPTQAPRRLRLLGALLLLAGAVLFLIAAVRAHPAFKDLEKTRGWVDTVQAAPAHTMWDPELVISDRRYVYRGPVRLFAGLTPGDTVSVWSRELGSGLREIWQLSSHGRMVVFYVETLARARAADRRMEAVGLGLAVLGALLAMAGWRLARLAG